MRDLKLAETLLNEPVSSLREASASASRSRVCSRFTEIMIFDEPTSALDPLSADQAVQLIRGP